MEIPTYSYHEDGIHRYHQVYFSSILWLCPDVYPFSLHLFLVHSVRRILTFSHGFSCIRSVYNMYTSGFTFPGLLYDH